jgi:hypothetical protein
MCLEKRHGLDTLGIDPRRATVGLGGVVASRGWQSGLVKMKRVHRMDVNWSSKGN